MIREIIMQNIKGQNTVQPLTGKDIICGHNGAGKTTRAQAVGISLLGYVPSKGKLPAETFKLSSNGIMTVGLKTDDFEFARSFTKNEKNGKNGSPDVTVSQDIMLSPSHGEKTIKQKEARLLSELGNFPVMLDFNEFLSLSDGKRREFIYNLSGIDSDKWDKARIENTLQAKLLTTELEVNNPDKFSLMLDIITDAVNQYPDNYDLQQGLQSMIEYAKNKLSYWNSEKKNAEGAVKKIAELKNDLTETDRNISQNKQLMENMRNELVNIASEIAKETEKKKALDNKLKCISELLQDIEVLKAQTCPDNTEDLIKAIAENKAMIKQVDYTEEINIQNSNIAAYKEKLELLQVEADEITKAVIEAKTAQKTYRETLDTIESQAGRCIIDARIKCDKDFTKYIEHSNAKVHEYTKTIEESVNRNEKLRINKEKIKAQISDCERSIKEFDSETRAVNQMNENIRRTLVNLENRLNKAQNFEELRQEKLKSKQLELEKLQNEPTEVVGDIDALQNKKESLEGQIKSLKAKLEEQEKTRITLSNLKSSMIDSKTAMYNADCWKYVAEELGSKGIQGQIVKEMLDPIKNDIQDKLNRLGIDKEFYFTTESDTGKEIFQFGWKNGFGDCYNFDALSTGEQMMLLIAMIVTIIERSAPKLKILMIDDTQDIDAENFANVVRGLDIIGNNLDNIILLGVRDELKEGQFEGWNIWRLGKEDDRNESMQISENVA